MQLAAAELDPSLDPFSVAGSFYLRQLADRMRTLANPGHLFYEGQKVRVRAIRLLEALERSLGVRGGTGLQVDFRGSQDLTAAIGLAGRRIAVGLAAATAIVGTAVTASAAGAATWATATFAAAGRAADWRLARRRAQAPLNASPVSACRDAPAAFPRARLQEPSAGNPQHPHVRGRHRA